MIRIGLLGASKIAPKAIIIPARKRQDCIITAVAARDITRARSYAKLHEIPNFETDYIKLCQRDDIDLIYNALPPSRHLDTTLAALKAGKAVLCEKPFAMNAEDARIMVQADTKGLLVEGYHYRFHPAFLEFESLIQSGAIGDILHMEGHFCVPIPDRDGELRHVKSLGGGALMDLGCYPLHAMRTLTKLEPVIHSVQAVEGKPGIDLVMQAALEFDHITAHLHCNMQINTQRRTEITLIGKEGTASFYDFVHPYRGFDINLKTAKKVQRISLDNRPNSYREMTTYDAQISHVLDVIADKALPLTGGLDAINTMITIDKIYQKSGLGIR